MSRRSVPNNFFRKFMSDPFWPLPCFSWIYYHWTGSSLVRGIIFSTLVIAVHLTIWMSDYYRIIVAAVKSEQTDVSVVIYYSIMVTHTLTIPFLVTVWMIRGRQRVHRFISTIATVDEELRALGECPSKKSTLRKLLLLSCCPLVLIGTLRLPMMNLSKLELLNTVKAQSKSLFYSFYHNLVVFYTIFFFAVLTLLVGERYRAVNSVLKKISQEYSYDLGNIRQLTSDWIVTIRELRALHRRLFFAAETITKAFGFQLLVITIVALITAIGDLYIFDLKNGEFLPCDAVLPKAIEYLTWGMHNIGPLCIAAYCCSWTSDQEKYTVVLLQEMSVSDDSLRMEISTFYLQLIHCDLHFTACGFFDIELSFIRIIFGTIATYSVILIQIGTLPQCRADYILLSRSFRVITNRFIKFGVRPQANSSSEHRDLFSKMIRKIRALLHPHGFFAALWPYRYSCMLFGQCNSASKIWRGVYGTSIVSVHLTLSYFMFYEVYKSVILKSGSNAQLFMAHFTFWSKPIFIIINASMWASVGHTYYTKIVSSSTIVDQELVQLCSKHVNLKTMVIRQLVCLASSVSISITRAVLNIFARPDAINLWNVSQIGVIYYSEVVINVVGSFFGNMVYFTGDRYALINAALKEIGKSGPNKADGNNLDQAALTRQLRVVHQKLFFVSRNITQAFAVQAVACVLVSFVYTINVIYFVYMIEASLYGERNFYKIVYTIIGIFSNFATVTYIAYCCHRTVKEANGTTNILNSLITSSEDLRTAISSFSDQLMHYKLHFSPLGFFELDLALLQNLAGSMATYLIILVQMQSVLSE